MNLQVPVYNNMDMSPHSPVSLTVRGSSVGGWGSLQRRKTPRPVTMTSYSPTATPPPPVPILRKSDEEALSSLGLAQWFREEGASIHDLPLQVLASMLRN